MSDLSPTMQKLVQFMRENDNRIVRHPGGFWRTEKTDHHGVSFSTPSVMALVSRGVAEYSNWIEGRKGRFPSEAILVAEHRSPSPAAIGRAGA